MLTRRALLALPFARAAAAANPLAGDALYRDVVRYAWFGEHRTASYVDRRTSDWIHASLRSAGLEPSFQTFTTRQFTPRACHIDLGGRRLTAFPLWPVRATGPAPVHALLSTASGTHRGRIALLKFPAAFGGAVTRTSGHAAMIRAAADAGAVAILALTESATGEIVALNAEAEIESWPVPVALFAARDEAALQSAAGVSLVINGRFDGAAQARNAIGLLKRGPRLIVVSTPQSGWFRCGAERGPGVALFLALARWATQRKSDTSWLFVATSGHELDGIGMRAFLASRVPAPAGVHCWLHLGAGIASYAWGDSAGGFERLPRADANRYLSCSPELAAPLARAFAGISGFEKPISDRSFGETKIVLARGYRAFGFAAAHRYHHTPADSAAMTGPELIAPVGQALIQALEALS